MMMMIAAILTMLRSASTDSFGLTPYHIMQENWRAEIAIKNQELSKIGFVSEREIETETERQRQKEIKR
jgi:hypothetical protein